MFKTKNITLTLAFLCSGVSAFATPFTYTYVNWTSAVGSSSTTPGSASGTMIVNGQLVTVTYVGDLSPNVTQTGSGSGTNYFLPASTYTNSQVANLPTNNNIIGLSQAYQGTNTLTFSSPVVNPILDIFSLGQPAISIGFNFNATPTVLSEGPSALYNNTACSPCLSANGAVVTGAEGNGVVGFAGTYSSISWVTTGTEYWNGFTVGVQDVASNPITSATPEPGTTGMLAAAGIAALGLARKWRT